MTATGPVDAREPAIGNGRNEFGWVDSSDSPYFIPGVPCTTAYVYDTVTGLMSEADTTCNAMDFQWPADMFGLFTQEDVVDAESAALAAFGTWLGLDSSLTYGDPMYPVAGDGAVRRSLTSDEFAFGRHQYGDGSSTEGSIAGRVRFPDDSPIPNAYVSATSSTTGFVYGAVADADGEYSIPEVKAGAYSVLVRPLTTDPYVLSSPPYRANPIANLDFTPEYHAGAVSVSDGAIASGVDITAARAGSQPDAFEPNDTAAAGTSLTLGFSKLATTHAPLDNDWYSFQTAPGSCYLVATSTHGASIVPTLTVDRFWSQTRLSLYDGSSLIGRNESRDIHGRDPGNWMTYCESGPGRRLDIEIEQREPVGGAGFFYAVSVQAIPGGSALAPLITALYPESGWVNRNRFVWIQGANFLPGARVEIRPPGSGWLPAAEAVATSCDAAFRCEALKALFPSSPPGAVDVRVTNPDGQGDTRLAAFTYLPATDGPLDDVTPQAFGVRSGQGKAVCVGDYDGDGNDDILKTRYGSLPNQLFHNNGDGTLTDVASSAGLRFTVSSFGRSCSWVDVDDDGDLDAYITNVAYSFPSGAVNELYRNRLADDGSASFALDATAGTGGVPSRYKSDAAWADFDKDGRIDVVLAFDSYAGSPPYPEAVQLLRQAADGSFADMTAVSGLGGYVAPVTSVHAADFDNDTCDDLAFFTQGGVANRLYKGDCHGRFVDATASSRIADGAPWCRGVALADFNNDGSLDILCGTYNTGVGPIRPRMWLNNGHAVFTDRAAEGGLVTVARNMDVVLPFDEDNDGWIDLYIGGSETGAPNDRRDVLLRNIGGNPPTFTDVTDESGMYPTTQDGAGLCTADVDEFYCDRDAAAGGVLDWLGDGAQDVFVTGDDPDGLQRGSDFLWRNRHNVSSVGFPAPANDWIEVGLKGSNTPLSRVLSNRSGLGARVTVIPRLNLPSGAPPTETLCLQNPTTLGVVAYTREVLAGHRSQSSTVLHFGLGSTLPFGQKHVDCIVVLWPSGLERAYVGLEANSKLVLAEDVARLKVIRVVPNVGPNSQSNPTTILGLRFDRDVNAVPRVLFGAVPASSVTFVSDHELTVLPPLWQQPGPVDVTVVNTDGQSDTLVSGYTYTGDANGLHIKDPVPTMLSGDGSIPNDAEFLVAHGAARTGVIADGATQLVLEAVVSGPGTVRFTLDDDADPNDATPSSASVGTVSAVGGSAVLTGVTVAVSHLADGRYIAHAKYTAPQNFIRSPADEPSSQRPLWIRATYVDPSSAEHSVPARQLDLLRVPVLYVHGMWGSDQTITWPVVNDVRWLSHRTDYRQTSGAAFDENAGMPPRSIAELRKQLSDRGIAGTRFFVVGYSMGGALFRVFMSGAGAAYARPDNFFAGDVYALVLVDVPVFGSYLATWARQIQSIPLLGSRFSDLMRALDMPVDAGCMEGLDPEGPTLRTVPDTFGTFHAIAGWGGGEMRDAAVALSDGTHLAALQSVLELLDFDFDSFLLRCSSGDDFVVCVESQEGGLSGVRVSDFHFDGPEAEAIHFDSITEEAAPSLEVERLLNTPITNSATWGHELPAVPPPGLTAVIRSPAPRAAEPPRPENASDTISMTLSKQGDGVRLSWTGLASRLVKSFSATLVPGVCLAVSGSEATDARALVLAPSTYYAVGGDGLCAPGSSLTIASVSPGSGSSMGGYPITLLGTGFTPTVRVRIGALYAARVDVINSTTLTFTMMPGRPGPTTMTVSNPGGESASAPFTLVDPGPVSGEVHIVSPAPGTSFTVGSTLTVSAVGSGGFQIAKGFVAAPRVSSGTDSDPGAGFSTQVTLPGDAVGPVALNLLARDEHGNLKAAEPVTIDVLVPGAVSVLRLEADRVVMLYGSPSRTLRVYGVYSDGVRREVTRAPGIRFEMDTQDIRKPNYPYNGTGVAVVDPSGLITAKSQGTTVCHVSYGGRQVDVVVEVAEIRPALTVQMPGFISWPFQGAGATYDVVRGKLSALRIAGGNYSDPAVAITCIKNDFANVTAADASNPSPGEGHFYLMRESRTRSYEESPFWPTRAPSVQRTELLGMAPGRCP